MTYVIKPAPGPWGIDSDEVFSETALAAIWTVGARTILTYAEILTAQILQRYTTPGPGYGGFAVSVITYSRPNAWVPTADTGAADARKALDVVHSLQVPPGLTIWDDVEGPSQDVHPQAIIDHVDGHAAIIAAAADIAGDYIGWGTMLTSEEWQGRPNVHAYWKAGGVTRDRYMKAVEPSRGWQCIQGLPFNERPGGGAIVDYDFLPTDQRGSRVMAICLE